MIEDTLTFDQLPQAVATLIDDVREIKSMCLTLQAKEEDTEAWLSVDDLRAMLPDHPSKPTIYRWVCQKTIPYYKDDKTRALRFKKSEILQWLSSGRRMTHSERDAIHDEEILSIRRVKKGGCDDN